MHFCSAVIKFTSQQTEKSFIIKSYYAMTWDRFHGFLKVYSCCHGISMHFISRMFLNNYDPMHAHVIWITNFYSLLIIILVFMQNKQSKWTKHCISVIYACHMKQLHFQHKQIKILFFSKLLILKLCKNSLLLTLSYSMKLKY